MGDIEKQEINESEVVTAKIMECHQRIHEANKRPTETPVVPTVTSGVPSVPSSRPKLPKLTLLRFRGELTTWKTLCDSFKSTVHENNSMSKIDKFSYLKSLLEGPASGCFQ